LSTTQQNQWRNAITEKISLNTDARSVPVYENGKFVGERTLDISLAFDPYDDPQRSDGEEFKKHVGSIAIPTGADSITWGYGLNTKRTSTYGGEVVQILSMYADKMMIKGTCRNLREQRFIYEYFKKYMTYITGSGNDGSGLDRRQNFLQLRYPARNWSFIIMVVQAPNMVMATKQAAPEWSIVAEIVSENDRMALGQNKIDQWADVLTTIIPRTSRRGAGASISGAARTFNIKKDSDPFGNLMDYMDGGRGAVAENFEAMIASYATGSITSLRTDPLNTPDPTAAEIWNAKFGSGGISLSSGGGAVGNDVPQGSISYGSKTRVFATAYGGRNDPTSTSTGHAGGQAFDLNQYPDSYAELSTNASNSVPNGNADGSVNDYAALGGLAALTPIKVTYNGKSKVLYKRDVGFGGNGPDKKRGSGDDPKIDLWWKAAEELGFGGFDWVDIEIGTSSGGGETAVNPSDLAQFKPISGKHPEIQGASSQFNYPDGPEGPETSNGGNQHSAYDFMSPAGTPIYAPASGKMVSVSYNPATSGQVFGDSFKLQLRNGYVWVFRHTKAEAKEGDTVQGGQRLGAVGAWNGGTHTHIEIWKTYTGGYKQSNMIDPLTILKTLYK